MKKLITLLLVLALLVPLCLVANAAAEKKEFYAVTWSNDIEGCFSNVKNLYTITVGMMGENVKLGSLVHGSFTDEQVEKMAKAMKAEMDKRAEGERYIHFFGPSETMALVEKEVYFDEATTQLTKLTTALFDKYAEIGGKIDGAMMSMLYPDLHSYYVDKSSYHKIVSDSRYKTEIRPLLAERGFVFYEKPTQQTPEIYGISGNAGSKYANCAGIWDTVMDIRLNTAIRQWAYEPMAKHFPNVHVADYQSTDTDAWMKPVNAKGNVMGGSGGNNLRAGNASCEKFYSNTPSNDDFYGKVGISYKSIPTYMGTYYRKTSFNNFRYDTNTAKQCYIADSTGDVCFWINMFSDAEDTNTSIANSPYYAEQVFHLALYDPKPFVLFMNTASVKGDELKQGATVVNDLLGELNRIVGYADRKPIEMPVDWNSEFVISGMSANGKNYWRITPNRDLTTKKAFKTAGKDPTFSLAGQTVTFPGGKIIEDSKISGVETMGYWVETDKKTTPVITSDENRFADFPAYKEDFESYNVNGKLQSTNLRDPNGWVVNPKGSDMLIASFAGSKVLTVTGDSILKNQNIPANMTAGDSYAKKQAWEVTITIPDGIAADAKMTLLNYEAKGTQFDDGGFLLQGNKLYYATGEATAEGAPVYAELMAAKAGTYTLKRDMNFGESFFCDYTVTDASGKVLKSVEKVFVPAFSGKVSTIGLVCENMNKSIMLDNYTLRVTSAAADLYLYDTALGTKVEDGAKRTASTTYRLSWANASQRNETATVKAAVTAGGKTTVKTLKTVTMKPGCDGVEYGAVDVKSGESVKIYLETSIKDEKLEKPAATEPAETEPETPETTKETQAKLTKPTRATKETKVPTKASKVTKATEAKNTKATKPTETLALNQTEATDQTEAAGQTLAPEQTQAPEESFATDPTEATGADTPDDAKGKSKGTTVAIIIASAVGVLAAAGGASIFVKKKLAKKSTAANATDSPEEPGEDTEE